MLKTFVFKLPRVFLFLQMHQVLFKGGDLCGQQPWAPTPTRTPNLCDVSFSFIFFIITNAMEGFYDTFQWHYINLPERSHFRPSKNWGNELREKRMHQKSIIHIINKHVIGLLKEKNFQILENSRQLTLHYLNHATE